MSDQWDMGSHFGSDSYTKKLTPPPLAIRRAAARLAAKKAGQSPELQEALMKKLMRQLNPKLLEKLLKQLKGQGGLLRLYMRPEVKQGRKIAQKDEKEAKRLAERMAQWHLVMQRAAEEAETVQQQRQAQLTPAPAPVLRPEEFAWLYGMLFGVRDAWARSEALLAEQSIQLNEAQMSRFQEYVLHLSGVSQQLPEVETQSSPFQSITEELRALFGVMGDESSPTNLLRVQQVAITSAQLIRDNHGHPEAAQQSGAEVVPFSEYLTHQPLMPFQSASVDNVVPLFGQGRKHHDDEDDRPTLR